MRCRRSTCRRGGGEESGVAGVERALGSGEAMARRAWRAGVRTAPAKDVPTQGGEGGEGHRGEAEQG